MNFSAAGFLTGPSFAEIFTDFGNDGFRTSFREFLGYFVKQFWPGVNTQIDKLAFSRIDYPLLVFPFFIAAIITFWNFWQRPTVWRGALAGFSAGLLFYVYFSAWAYWVTVIGLLAGYTMLFRRQDRERRNGFVALLAVLAILAVPFAANYLAFSAAPGAEDFIYRQWLAEGREPGLVALGYAYLFYALLAAAVVRLYARNQPETAALFLAMIAAMVVVWNAQLITGFVPAPDHWKRIASPILFVILARISFDVVYRIRARRPALAQAVVILAALLTVSAVTKKVVNAVAVSRQPQEWVLIKHEFPQELADSWQWMNEYLPPEPKVISPSSMTSQYLAVYTSARPYVPYGILTPMPMAEIEERYLAASKLFGVPEDILRASLGEYEKIPACGLNSCFDQRLNFTKTRFNLYGCYFSRGSFNATVNRICAMPDEYREVMIERYRRVAADWADVDAEYVYSGPHERQFGGRSFRGDPGFVLVYENPLVEIYRIKE